MDMATRLPSMTDQQLSTMRGNAERLGEGGNSKQKTEAARLLPLIQAEIDERKARAPAPVKAVRKPRKKPEPAKKKAAAVAEDGDED